MRSTLKFFLFWDSIWKGDQKVKEENRCISSGSSATSKKQPKLALLSEIAAKKGGPGKVKKKVSPISKIMCFSDGSRVKEEKNI